MSDAATITSTSITSEPESVPPAPRRDGVKTVSIKGRKPVPELRYDVDLFYSVDGRRINRRLTISRPTHFDEVLVAVVDEDASPAPSLEIPAFDSIRGAARAGYWLLRNLRSRLGPPLLSSKPLFDTRSFEPNNFSHLLLDIIPLCRFANSALEGDVRHVFRKVNGPFLELLDILEVDVLLTEKRLAGNIVHVRGMREYSAYDLLGTFDVPAITVLPDIYDDLSFGTAGHPSRIFINRRDARSLLNTADVVSLLTRYGYETIYMEDYDVREQLNIAASARHVVAIHGAGMASLIMNKDLSSVIELLPPHVFHKHFPISLGHNAKHYALLMPSYDEAVVQSGWQALLAYKNAPFAVDLASLELALAKVHG